MLSSERVTHVVDSECSILQLGVRDNHISIITYYKVV